MKAPATTFAVDDDDAVRSSLQRILGRRFTVETAGSGEDALRRLESGEIRPDLILLDVRMPGLDGYEVCRRIQEREELAWIPVIFVTVLDSEQDRERALEVGGAGYVAKPFETERLLEAVDQALEAGERWESARDAGGSGEPGDGEEIAVESPGVERFLPPAFENFKEHVADLRDASEEDRSVLDAIEPAELYAVAPLLDMSEEQLTRYLARYLDVESVERIAPDAAALGELPRAFCQSNLVVPREDGSVVLANPFDLELLDALGRSVWRRAEPRILLADPEHIAEIFEEGEEVPMRGVADAKRVIRLAVTRSPAWRPSSWTGARKTSSGSRWTRRSCWHGSRRCCAEDRLALR